MDKGKHKKPAYQWYPGDWQKDKAVRKCSVAARGAWRELLDLMHSDDCSELTGTPLQFSRLIVCSEDEAASLLVELVSNEVCDCDGERVTFSARVTARNVPVTLVSRRLYRERKSKTSNALRQAAFRQRGDGNTKVTPPSSSSSSSSCTPPPPIGGLSCASHDKKPSRREAFEALRSAISDGRYTAKKGNVTYRVSTSKGKIVLTAIGYSEANPILLGRDDAWNAYEFIRAP